MRPFRPALIATACCLALLAPHLHADEAIARESRDAAAAFMATMNFVVGRLGLECLAEVGRTETPKDFTLAWRQRNADYYAATTAYMTHRLEVAQASGGDQLRETVMREYVTKVRQNGEASVVEWFRTGTRQDACRRAIAAIDAGAMDVSAKAPIHAELKALVDWAASR